MGGEALQFTKKKGNTLHCLSKYSTYVNSVL